MAYSNSEKAILKTIIYSDIFDFPLSKEEIWHFLISDKKIDKNVFEKSLKKLSTKISHKDDFYCLIGKEKNITKRKFNLHEVERKQRLAKRAAYGLSFIPTILFIGLSGGVAVGDVDEKDDIDLFIITKKNKLFVTRFLALIILEVLSLRRKRNDPDPTDKICINLLIDETSLSWPMKRRDIYTGREIVQLKPLFERGNIYKRFIRNNQWIKLLFPNTDSRYSIARKASDYYVIRVLSAVFTIWPVEIFMKMIQKKIMKKYHTNEYISDQVLAFHPHDYRRHTLQIFSRKMRHFPLLTKV